MKQKIKLGIILGVEFIAIAVILILIFFAGKKTYKVTFDLNGGTLISGELVQTVPQGKNATPPTVAKEGCYLRSWSASYKQVTRDIVVEAVWEWEIITTVGFDYSSTDNSDYCTIENSFVDLYGDVYVPTHHDNLKILGIAADAFKGRDGITYVHMLDGIISIGDGAFSECDNLTAIELSGTIKKLGTGVLENCVSLETVVLPDKLEVISERTFKGCVSLEEILVPENIKVIGKNVFEDCESLKKVELSDGLEEILDGAFRNCTALEEIVIPATVKVIGENAFEGCTSLKKITFETKDEPIESEDEENEDEKNEEDPITVLIGLVEIKSGAFKDCSALTEVHLPETIEIIGENAFDNAELTVYIPLNEADVHEGFAENWHGSSTVEWKYPAPAPEDQLPENNDGV